MIKALLLWGILIGSLVPPTVAQAKGRPAPAAEEESTEGEMQGPCKVKLAVTPKGVAMIMICVFPADGIQAQPQRQAPQREQRLDRNKLEI